MYKLIIVDDEKRVREALKISIDWEKYDIELVADAEDGDIALKLIKEHSPDIIITDIYMARLNGLELIERLQELVPHAKTIILSGYDNFNYAQTALRNKAFDYLLKPIRFDKLEETIKRAVNKIKDEEQERNNFQKFRKQLQKYLPVIKERYIDYLLSNRLSYKEIKEQEQYLNLNLLDNNFVVLVMDVASNLTAVERLGIKEAIAELLFAEFNGEIIDNYPNKYNVIINYGEKQDHNQVVKSLLTNSKKIINYINKMYEKIITIGIGGLYKDDENIINSYHEALEALEYKLFYGQGEVYLIQDISSEVTNSQINYPFRIEDEIMMSLKLGNYDNLKSNIQSFFTYYLANEEINPNGLRQACLQLLYTLYKKMIEWNCNIEKSGIEDKITSAVSHQELKKVINGYFYYISDHINQEKQKNNNSYINSVCSFIKNNYQRDISLEDIADEVYLSPNYLSNIFKEELGDTIISYLTEVRINNAKDLLINTKLKVYEIAKRVGYKNSTYFGQVFKKKTDLSPQEYRNRNI